MKKLNFPQYTRSRADIANLHTAFKLVKLNVSEEEIAKKRFGQSTQNAIKDFQKRHKLPVDGNLDEATLSILNDELFDIHHAVSKTRTKKLHDLLDKLELPVATDEKNTRKFGEDTRRAIKLFQKQKRLKQTGKLDETIFAKLQEAVIKKTYSTKTQIGKLQKTFQKVNIITNLNIDLAPGELKAKKLGKAHTQEEINWIIENFLL